MQRLGCENSRLRAKERRITQNHEVLTAHYIAKARADQLRDLLRLCAATNRTPTEAVAFCDNFGDVALEERVISALRHHARNDRTRLAHRVNAEKRADLRAMEELL